MPAPPCANTAVPHNGLRCSHASNALIYRYRRSAHGSRSASPTSIVSGVCTEPSSQTMLWRALLDPPPRSPWSSVVATARMCSVLGRRLSYDEPCRSVAAADGAGGTVESGWPRAGRFAHPSTASGVEGDARRGCACRASRGGGGRHGARGPGRAQGSAPADAVQSPGAPSGDDRPVRGSRGRSYPVR